MAEKTVQTGAKPQRKFPVERLAQGCRALFGVSSSTFAGATAGLSGEYTVAEMKDIINDWLKKPVGKGGKA